MMFIFVIFHQFSCHVSVFGFLNDIMYYIIANIRVCCQTFIYFVIEFGRVYIIIYNVYDIFKLYVFFFTFGIVTTTQCYF